MEVFVLIMDTYYKGLQIELFLTYKDLMSYVKKEIDLTTKENKKFKEEGSVKFGDCNSPSTIKWQHRIIGEII